MASIRLLPSAVAMDQQPGINVGQFFDQYERSSPPRLQQDDT